MKPSSIIRHPARFNRGRNTATTVAHIYSGRGQFRDAIREYDFALQYTANRDMALLCLNELGEAELRIGDYVTAENFVARALAIDPTDSTAQQLRQQILQRKGGAN
jgi:tetratricopeptide (TPR) repeat protein